MIKHGDLKLPACEKCRLRKIRCDNLAPKCTPCQRRNLACIIIDPSTQERYSRQSVQELEDRLRHLEAQTKHQHHGGPHPSDALPPSARSADWEETTVGTPFVGDGSGISFLKHVFSSTKWTKARADLTRYLSLRPTIPDTAIGAYNLPSFEQASILVEEYFSKNHVVHPFLDPGATRISLRTVYQQGVSTGTPQDMYRIFMVLAIASVTNFRTGRFLDNPYGYFMAAQRLADNVPMLGGIDGIQNLLLIARFAMYYYINCSIWDIARICMRQCVELGLHRKPLKQADSQRESLEQKIFWDCYVHDRYSSATLGRPYAIDDKDIEVEPPDTDRHSTSAVRMPVSIFGFLVGLRRITSRMHTEFLSNKHHQHSPTSISLTTAGRIYTQLQAFLSELREWRRLAPSFPDAHSLFEREEWYDFVVEKDQLALIRGAMSQLLAAAINIPKQIHRQCLQCSCKVIDAYAGMFQRGHITWNRSYFHIIFNAGLSIMYCLSSLSTGGPRDSGVEQPTAKQAEASLRACKTVLTAFEREMPDTRAFVLVFGALRHRFSNGMSASQPNTRAETPIETAAEPGLYPGGERQNRGLQANVVPQSLLEPVYDGGFPGSSSSDDAMAVNSLLVNNPSALTSFDVFPAHNTAQVPTSDGLLETFPFQDFETYDGNLFDNDMLEHMEAGLGQYAWGNLLESNSIWNQWSADSRDVGRDFANTTFY